MKRVEMNSRDVKEFIEIMKTFEDYHVSENGKGHDASINGKHIYFYEGEDNSEHAIMHAYRL